jgi:Wall-associated receptor kinase C-terminal
LILYYRYLCRNLPGCPSALQDNKISCCTYYPKASESLRLMLRHCESYTGVYWRTIGTTIPPYDQVPEYGIRIDFEIPVTTRCLECEDNRKGGGVCGFDTESRDFLCLCQDGNTTTFCSGKMNICWIDIVYFVRWICVKLLRYISISLL